MQRSALESRDLAILVPPNGSSQEHLCHNQRARSGQAQNFSVLAIGLILGLGLLIIYYRRLAWKSNGLLQLQRLAHEEAGFGTWERRAKNVPVTIPGETLATLDVNDPEHPTLLKTPVLSNQPLQPKSTTTHIGSPQKTDTTAITALSAEIEPKPVDGEHETGGSPFQQINLYTLTHLGLTERLNSSSSANNTGGPNLGFTMPVESTPDKRLPGWDREGTLCSMERSWK
ncbi:hypothetical protein HO173_010339 [Letharia columbiana]|uniref:Uncharacterized protein n=1 Tax=Letharia columbiana TaxID=112416 RepID=A0A8H6FMR0_9LECA|nr:uncharacterized protein HO173_010339 [Letharia columbiana]KAF6231379.1 hypothetical protein HO173_010339 [Letharia columbiana]